MLSLPSISAAGPMDAAMAANRIICARWVSSSPMNFSSRADAPSISFWMPSFIRAAGVQDPFQIGLMTAIRQAGDDQGAVGRILQRAGVTPEQLQGVADTAQKAMADAFASAFTVATLLVALVLVPAFMLPRRRIEVDRNPEHTAAGFVH